jgi:hypothetical protein
MPEDNTSWMSDEKRNGENPFALHIAELYEDQPPQPRARPVRTPYPGDPRDQYDL